MRTVTTRTITGRVNANGTIAAGDGFTVQRTAAGQYTITFSPAFRLIGAVLVGAQASTNTVYTADTWTDRSFRALALVSGAFADTPFAFIATGASA